MTPPSPERRPRSDRGYMGHRPNGQDAQSFLVSQFSRRKADRRQLRTDGRTAEGKQRAAGMDRTKASFFPKDPEAHPACSAVPSEPAAGSLMSPDARIQSRATSPLQAEKHHLAGLSQPQLTWPWPPRWGALTSPRGPRLRQDRTEGRGAGTGAEVPAALAHTVLLLTVLSCFPFAPPEANSSGGPQVALTLQTEQPCANPPTRSAERSRPSANGLLLPGTP